MSVPTGGIDESKKRLMALIREAEPLAHVFGDWRPVMENLYSPKTGLKLPVVTVRVNPATVRDMTWGRRIPESGDMGLYSFSAHCFASACTASGEEEYKHAHDLADKIMKHLTSRDYNSAPHTSYGIVDVFDLNARESEPAKGAIKVCRVIIEGTMLVKRVDT